jgi:Flp pilus assembly protein TadD
LRHILPIYPFLFVLIGGTVAQLWQSGTRFKKAAVILLGLWYLWSSVSIYPHYLAFFNEVAGGAKNGHRIAVDSNLDWGQDLPGLKEWMDANGVKKIQFLYFGFYGAAEPQYYGIDAISATHLYGPVPDVEEFVKPFTTIAPIATVGHSIYIYSMERAIEQLHQAVRLHPASAVAHHDLAILLENQGKVDEAMYHYRVALQIDPVYKKVNYQMANSLTKWGEVERAINHYRLVLETDSSYADAHESLGLLLALRGELTGATEHFYQALKLDPTRSETHFHLGVALAKQSDFAEAAKQFREALRIKPDYAEAYNNLGRVLAAQGQLDRAIEFFRQAIHIKPSFAEAHHSLAIALDEKGKKDEAAQELQEAFSLMQSQPLAEAAR